MEFVDSCAKCSEDAESAEALYGIFTNKESKSQDLVSYISQRAIPSILVFQGDFFRLQITDAVVLKEIWSSGLRFNCFNCERSIGHQDYEFSSIFEETISSPEINQEICLLIAATIIESIDETVDSIKQEEWFVSPLLAQVLNSDQFSNFLYNSLLPNEARIKLRAALTSLSEFEQDFVDAEADSGSGDAGNAVFQNAAAYLDESSIDGENSSEGENDAHDEQIRDIDASDPTLDLPAQQALLANEDEFVRWGLATNTSAYLEILETLSRDSSTFVRSGVAANPRCSLGLVEFLSNDSDVSVLSGLASNPNVGTELLIQLIEKSRESEENVEIRQGVAKNPNLSGDLFVILSKDEDELVRISVADNLQTPVEVLERLVSEEPHGEDYGVRRYLAGNPNCPVELLEILAMDSSSGVRSEVAGNPNVSPEVLSKLATDPDEYVRSCVQNNPISTGEIKATSYREKFGPTL